MSRVEIKLILENYQYISRGIYLFLRRMARKSTLIKNITHTPYLGGTALKRVL